MPNAEPVFRVLLRTHIRADACAEFERVWTEVAEGIGHHPANRGQWLMAAVSEPGVYYIITDWTDEASFRAFERGPDHVRNRARLQPYRSGDSMVTTRVVRELATDRGSVR